MLDPDSVRSCPKGWCKSGSGFALSGRAGRYRQAAATAGNQESAAGPTKPPRRVQVKVGRVVSNKMQKTVIVTVENTATHRLYHRYMKRTSKFAAHDAENRLRRIVGGHNDDFH